jgi:hypothetical protein
MDSYDFSYYLDAEFPIPPIEAVTHEAYRRRACVRREYWMTWLSRLELEWSRENRGEACSWAHIQGSKGKCLVLLLLLAGYRRKAQVERSAAGAFVRARIPPEHVAWWNAQIEGRPMHEMRKQAALAEDLFVDGSVAYTKYK